MAGALTGPELTASDVATGAAPPPASEQSALGAELCSATTTPASTSKLKEPRRHPGRRRLAKRDSFIV